MTAKAKRTIELPADLIDWLADHRRQQIAERLAASHWEDDRLVFASPNGRVIGPARARRRLATISSEIGVPRVTPNELHHSCASLLSDDGVPIERIVDLLGHTTTRMVEQTYRHRIRRSSTSPPATTGRSTPSRPPRRLHGHHALDGRAG